MGILFGILITIMVIDAIVGIIALFVAQHSWNDTWDNIACVCGFIFMVSIFVLLIIALITCDPKVGTGR